MTVGDDKRENKKDDSNDFGFGIPLIPIISSDIGVCLLVLLLGNILTRTVQCNLS